ncbi:mRNA-binding ribosome synthesis protein nop7 [Phlyctochytrium planicorne]|nr:mRNA-binding ribosome synthesis protein nop7 [Phlyctochytrium planicorne]
MGKIIKKGEKGAASNYITRAQAIRKLQLSLSDFRRICILKGIYPHEPKNKKKVGKGSTAPRTYYFKKDIQYLLHEPILQKFRDIKSHQRKLFKALTKREWAVAKSLESQTPKYSLDHVVKERYPSFVDALRDLDDALSIIFLFASLPSDSIIKPSRISNCQRLASEFQHYIIASKSLTKVFVSIKGIYYQAKIHGQDVTWIVPFQFSSEVPADVDLKIMSTFLELYETLLSFVNFKLYSELNYAYPPQVDSTREAGGAGLNAYILASADGKELLDSLSTGARSGKSKEAKKKLQKRLKTLHNKLEELNDADQEMDEDEEEEDDENEDDLGVPKTVVDPVDITEQLPSLEDASIQDEEKQRLLFKDLVFYLSREVPLNSLEFVIRSFGGKVGWDITSGAGSEFEESDSRITHTIVDRPLPKDAIKYENREYLQPQWVYDCINAKKLIKTKGYHPGETLPPHLSPFGNGPDGYDPTNPMAEDENEDAEEEDVTDGKDQDVVMENGEDAEGDEEEEEDDEESGEVEMDDDEDEAIYKAELEAEAAGLTFSEYMEKLEKEEGSSAAKKLKSTAKAAAVSDKKRKASQAELEAAEEKELAIMMMSKKDRRLYNQIQFGKNKKQAEADALRAKKAELEKTAKKQKTAVTAPAEEGNVEAEAKKEIKTTKKQKNEASKSEVPKPEPSSKKQPSEVPKATTEDLSTSKKSSANLDKSGSSESAEAKKHVKWAKNEELRKVAEFDKNFAPATSIIKSDKLPKTTKSEYGPTGIIKPAKKSSVNGASSKLAAARDGEVEEQVPKKKKKSAVVKTTLLKKAMPTVMKAVKAAKSKISGGFIVKKKS